MTKPFANCLTLSMVQSCKLCCVRCVEAVTHKELAAIGARIVVTTTRCSQKLALSYSVICLCTLSCLYEGELSYNCSDQIGCEFVQGGFGCTLSLPVVQSDSQGLSTVSVSPSRNGQISVYQANLWSGICQLGAITHNDDLLVDSCRAITFTCFRKVVKALHFLSTNDSLYRNYVCPSRGPEL